MKLQNITAGAKSAVRSFVGRAMIATSAVIALAFATTGAMADDISTVTPSVSGYVTAAIVVGVAVLLFVLGRKVLRRLI